MVSLRSVAEGEPVDVDEVGRLAAGEGEVDVVHAGDPADIRGNRAPALPASGVGDGEAADRRVAEAVQPHLDEAADTSGGTGRHPGAELPCRRAAEVDPVVAGPVPVGDPADIL